MTQFMQSLLLRKPHSCNIDPPLKQGKIYVLRSEE